MSQFCLFLNINVRFKGGSPFFSIRDKSTNFYRILTLIPYFFRFFFKLFKNVDPLPKKDIYCLFWAKFN